MTAIRLAASDLDGTLLRSDGTASSRTRATLDRCRRDGVRLLAVTGRPPRRVPEVAEQLGIIDEVVCANGAMVWHAAHGRLVTDIRMDPDTAWTIVTAVRAAVPDAVFAAEAGWEHRRGDGYATSAPTPAGARVGPLGDLVEDGVNKLIVKASDMARLMAVVAEVSGGRATPTQSVPWLVEIGPAGVTKASAAAELAQAWGVDPAETVAYGDMPNDLPLVRWAGIGVAVGNAHPSLREAADVVLDGTNDDDAVAAHLDDLTDAGRGKNRR